MASKTVKRSCIGSSSSGTNYTNNKRNILWLTLISIAMLTCQVNAQENGITNEFAPHVTATCKAGTMNIRVKFSGPYTGAVHARDFRTPACMSMGDGSDAVAFSLNLLAKQGTSDYCGILVSNVSGVNRTEERSIQLAVRVHKTLELADDKFYVITCGKSGFARDDNSHVALKFLNNEHRVRETVYGHEYKIRAEVTKPNGTAYGISVGNCFAFDKKNISIALIDERGCPIDADIISRFVPSADGHTAEATLYSMFKFPEGSEVHIQCDVIQCYGRCVDDEDCSTIALAGAGGGAGQTKGERKVGPNEEGSSLAGTTVYVLDPAEAPLLSGNCEDGIRPVWLLWLAIALGVLFLIMLLMNIFLCTAMSCSCANTEIIEKEPSIIEEYDPYRSWHGSQYGSRYSLHGRDAHKGYTSGGSTIHSNRSLPPEHDHYAIVHTRSDSRYSGTPGLHHQQQQQNSPQHKSLNRTRGNLSNM